MTGVPMLDEEGLRALRMRAQFLDRPEPAASPGDIARRVCGVQAQEISAAELALRARSGSITAFEAREARVTERSIVRTWAMRGTLHLIAAEDVGWLLPLFAPRFLPRSRRRLVQQEMLADEGALTRAEIADRLARRDIRTEGQAAFHLLLLAALEGLVCMGPDRGGKPAFVLLRDWIGQPSIPEEDSALAELARRYLSAYGPATPEDMTAWSGLGLTEVRRAWRLIADELVEADVGARRAWVLRSLALPPRPRGIVRLLPGYDNYLLGHRSRDFAVDPRHAREVHPGGGLIRPVALANGRAIATWRARRRSARVAITFQPFDPLDPGVEEGLEAEARDIGRFLNTSVELAIA